ncbi:hypothetical protein E2C01_039039 [Portunus trituberculatus]|uniref:Uncharacterized protein n=1 Tax=Portunus trituberculatus TaxID=210409 RepID=A0A5B7FDQ9_PORTR|nr:hypothetical protein [Portunus trituberculatus]
MIGTTLRYVIVFESSKSYPRCAADKDTKATLNTAPHQPGHITAQDTKKTLKFVLTVTLPAGRLQNTAVDSVRKELLPAGRQSQHLRRIMAWPLVPPRSLPCEASRHHRHTEVRVLVIEHENSQQQRRKPDKRS